MASFLPNGLTDNLLKLDLSNNSITNWPTGFSSNLTTLDLSNNKINLNIATALPINNLPATLQSLNIANNGTLRVDALPPILKYLDVSGNYTAPNLNFTRVNCTLPNTLVSLSSRKNNLTGSTVGIGGWPNISNLPKLKVFDIGNNALTSPASNYFSACSTTLQALSYGNNAITNLPTMPNSLTYIDCQNNPISVLNVSGIEVLRYLNCSKSNLLSSLTVPCVLKKLNCTNCTSLTSLVFFNGSEMIPCSQSNCEIDNLLRYNTQTCSGTPNLFLNSLKTNELPNAPPKTDTKIRYISPCSCTINNSN
jgi:Leucine Rich repeat